MPVLKYSLLIILALLMTPIRASAEAVLYIEITDNTQQADYVADFLSQLESELERENITLVTVQTPADFDEYGQFWLQESLHIVFFDSAVMVTPYVTHQLSPSPVLASAFKYMSLVDSTPDDAAHNLVMGMSLYIYERCAEAIAYFDAIDPQQIDNVFFTVESLDFYRGNCAILEGDLTLASGYYEQILDEATDGDLHLFFDVAINKAWILIQQAQSDEAFALVDRVMESVEQHVTESYFQASALSARADLYALGFRFDDAIADMDAAIALQPDNPELYVERGQIIMLLYEWDRVLEDYNTALELNSDYAEAYFHRGVLYYSILERESALADFERYLDFAPDGYYADEAEDYAESIRKELEALGG